MRRLLDRLDPDWIGLTAVTLVIIAVIAVAFAFLTRPDHARYDTFATHCQQAGGHLYQPDRTAWCLTPDGRIIEVYP